MGVRIPLLPLKFNNQNNQKLAKQDYIEAEGFVTENLSNGNFRVEINNGHVVLCTISGKIRMNNIRLIPGDRVKIQMSPYDLNRGRISVRLK